VSQFRRQAEDYNLATRLLRRNARRGDENSALGLLKVRDAAISQGIPTGGIRDKRSFDAGLIGRAQAMERGAAYREREDQLNNRNLDLVEAEMDRRMGELEGRNAPAGVDPGYGNRPDGTAKGRGWLGEIRLPDGGVATEYTMQSDAVKQGGKRIDFPTLVPSLSPEEVKLMRDDIIPNKKEIPEGIIQKAIDHAKSRLGQGRSVFLEKGDTPVTLSRAGAALDIMEGDRLQDDALAQRGIDSAARQGVKDPTSILKGDNYRRTLDMALGQARSPGEVAALRERGQRFGVDPAAFDRRAQWWDHRRNRRL
jgi:hypothetical protein